MKLVFAIVQDYDAPNLLRALTGRGFRATQITSTGGFLRAGNTTLLIGVEDADLSTLLRTIKDNCAERVEHLRPSGLIEFDDWYPPEQFEVEVGGATVFVCEVERFERV